MSTSVGAYATLAGVKARITPPDSSFDTLLQSFCDKVNGWIENKTGRILAPIPAFSTTTNGAISAGATSFTLTTASGLAVGDALMLGPVAGVHEHVIVNAIAGAVVTPQTAVVNAYNSGVAAQRCYLFDGAEALEAGHLIPAPNGVTAITSLEVAFYTGGAFNLIPPSNYFLRPLPLDREPGWPATEIWMTDIPTSDNPAPLFYATNWAYGGFATARVLGPGGGGMGWPAIQDELVDIAETLVVRHWQNRGSGELDRVGVTELGQPVISRLVSLEDLRTLNRYTSKEVVLV